MKRGARDKGGDGWSGDGGGRWRPGGCGCGWEMGDGGWEIE